MLSVSALNNFQFFDSFKLIAGQSGQYRNVTNVVILDYEGVEDQYVGFQTGDFVISNLLFAKDHPERIYKSFKTLIDLGVSAFAIKTVFYTSLPQEVIDLANECEVPIFTFHDIFIEDVIINITDHLRASTNFEYLEGLIDQFVGRSSNAVEIQQLLNTLSASPQEESASSLFLMPRDSHSDFALQRLISKTQLALSSAGESHAHVIRYKGGMLLISFLAEKTLTQEQMKGYWRSLLRKIALDTSLYIIGINDSLLDINQLDLSIRRCLFAYRSAAKNGEDFDYYSDLGIKNITLPLLEDSYISMHLLELVKKIEPACSSISEFKASSLYNTIEIYVSNHFDILATAEALYTHQNTIRYRIRKLKELTGIEDDTYFQLLLYALIHCDSL